MKKRLPLIIAVSIIFATLSFGREAEALPAKWEGSMMPYDFEKVEATQWPDSLTPRFCAYVARHGARFLTSAKKFDKLEKALREAESKGMITLQGQGILKMIDTVRSVTAGRWGQLSPVGLREERELGRRMAEMIPALTLNASADACSSFVPRAIMTMYEFNHSLSLCNDSLEITAASGPQFSRLVYCFAYDKEYAAYRKDGDWREVVKEYTARMIPTAPVKRLIDTKGMSKERLQELTQQLYSLLQSQRAMGLPAPDAEWMTAKEYEACWRVSNLTHYLRNTVTPLSTLAATATTPLIYSIIAHVNKSLAPGYDGPAFQGWFGHAETLMPLLSALQLPGCFALPHDYDELYKEWQLQNVTPLAANLAVIILSGPSGRDYAAVRLNGRNIEPIKGEGKIVPWSQLSAHWIHLVESVQNLPTAHRDSR